MKRWREFFQPNLILILIFLAFLVLIIAVVVSQKTGILPKADLPKKTPSFQDFIPSPLPPKHIELGNVVVTPTCLEDDEGCITCCIEVDGKRVCQDRTCPAQRSSQIE